MVPKVLAQDPPEIGLGTAVWRSVVVGQIEMGDAKVECSPHDGALSLERSVVAEILPKPERYGGEKQTAAPTTAVGHGPVAILSGIVDSHRHPHIRRMIWLASRAGNSPRSIHSRWPRARVIRTGHPFEHSSRFRFLGGAHGPSSRDIRCLQRPLQPGSRNQFQSISSASVSRRRFGDPVGRHVLRAANERLVATNIPWSSAIARTRSAPATMVAMWGSGDRHQQPSPSPSRRACQGPAKHP